MNAQERQLIDELFDRLSKLETAPRDADAEAAIREGWRRAPNAAYALVQTVLVQDEALKRANAHIDELQAQLQPQAQEQSGGQSGGFLDTMRDALFGSQQNQNRGSVPNIRPQEPTRPIWNSGQAAAQADPRYAGGPYAGGPGSNPGGGYGSASPYSAPGYGGGGSFLGTAAAAAAGVVGGSLLMGSIRNLMGGHHQAFADSSAFGSDTRTDQSNSTLAHDAGIDDIGRGGHDRDSDNSRQGLFDQASNDDDHDSDDYDGDNDLDGDSDGFDSGGDDVA
jgi:hypothetical protein